MNPTRDSSPKPGSGRLVDAVLPWLLATALSVLVGAAPFALG